MNTAEPLCDLRMIKADYRMVEEAGRASHRCFRITVVPDAQQVQFDVTEDNGELFAAELEALAAIIRSRVIRARIVANQ